MISGISDTFYTDHGLDVVNVSAGNDGDVDVGHVREPLQDVLRFEGKNREIGMSGDRREGTVVVEKKGQLVILADISRGHVVSLEGYPAFIMSRVAFARAGPAVNYFKKHYCRTVFRNSRAFFLACHFVKVNETCTARLDPRSDVPKLMLR